MSTAAEMLATADEMTRTREILDEAYADYASHLDAFDGSRSRLNAARQAFLEALSAHEKSTAILPVVSEACQ